MATAAAAHLLVDALDVSLLESAVTVRAANFPLRERLGYALEVIRNATKGSGPSSRLAARLKQVSHLRRRALKATEACGMTIGSRWSPSDAEVTAALARQHMLARRRMSDVSSQIATLEVQQRYAPRIRRVREALRAQHLQARRNWSEASHEAETAASRINREQERLLNRLDARAIGRLIDQRHALCDYVRGVNDIANDVLSGALA